MFEWVQSLIENPAAVLREAGIVLGLAVVVVVGSAGEVRAEELKYQQQEDEVYEIVIPSKPRDLEDTDLTSKEVEFIPQRVTGCC